MKAYICFLFQYAGPSHRGHSSEEEEEEEEVQPLRLLPLPNSLVVSSPECHRKGNHSRLLHLEHAQGQAVLTLSVLMETECTTIVAGHVPREMCRPVPLATSRKLLLFSNIVC